MLPAPLVEIVTSMPLFALAGDAASARKTLDAAGPPATGELAPSYRRIEGNLLLDYPSGADVRFVPAIDPMLAVGHDEAVVAQVVEEEAALGRKTYVIPVGGSSPVGAVGYVVG